VISAELRVELDGEELTVRLESSRASVEVLADDARPRDAARTLIFRVARAADAAFGGATP